MNISLENISKRFNQQWILSDINYSFTPNTSYAVLGANGSGKSTLLQLIAGNILPTSGKIVYSEKNRNISGEKVFNHVAAAAPYMELLEEFTLEETVIFHSHFKKFVQNFDPCTVIKMSGLDKSKKKTLKHFSSGMKQRVRLALAILSDTPLLLLDEPLTNLDKEGAEWYNELINTYLGERLVIVCSNEDEKEYGFCKSMLKIENRSLV